MYSKTKANFLHTTAFRLTAWFVVLFTGLSIAVFATSLFALHANLRQDLDEDLEEDVDELRAIYIENGIEGLQAEFNEEAMSDGTDEVFFALISPGGEILASSDLRAWKDVQIPPHGLTEIEVGQMGFRTVTTPDGEHKARVICKRIDSGNRLCIAESFEDDEELVELVRGIFGLSIFAMLTSGGVMGCWVARRSMSGVIRVTQTAVRIGKNELAERVKVGKEGIEIEELALAFNEMLSRIAALIAEIREMNDNIAHDLRSPITRLRGMAETTLTGSSQVDDDYQQLAAHVVEECDHMMSLINTMLEITETDSGLVMVLKEPVDIEKLLVDAGELFLPVADKKGVRIEVDVPKNTLMVRGDLSRLQRVVANLLDNAIKHTPKNGIINLSASMSSGQVIIKVVDTGMGMTPEEIPQIFQRFYRGDASRARPGNGLGLSLSQSIIHAHQGNITVKSVPGEGSTFSVQLPFDSDFDTNG